MCKGVSTVVVGTSLQEMPYKWSGLSTSVHNLIGRYITLPALMILPNNSLSLIIVEDQAEGWYMCEAENVGGTSESRVFLKVSNNI